jgi:hypothetical protein
VEISTGMQRARVFNLDTDDLLAKVVEPWLEDRRIELGDREWEPRTSSLKILEGPQMQTPDLSFGQGWSNAERASQNVTQRVLDEAPPPSLPDAFLIEADSPQAAASQMLAGNDTVQAIHWGEARRRLDGRDPQIAAVILVLRRPGSEASRS